MGKGLLPPQAIEIEESVLGQVMIDQNAFDNISEMFFPDIFYRENNQKIAESILNLRKNNIEIDMLSVCNELQKLGYLEKIGGPFAIQQLTEKVSSAANIEHHIRIVVDKFSMRELIRANYESTQKAYDSTQDPKDVIDSSQSNLMSIGSKFDVRKETSVSNIIRLIDKKINSDDSPTTFVPYPFKSVNKALNGAGNSEFIIIASRPRMGKTALAVYMAIEAAKKGFPVGFFSLEMSSEQIVMRMISSLTDIPLKKLEKCNKNNKVLTKKEWEKYDEAFTIIDNLPIYIDDTPSLSYIQFKSKARRMKKKYGIKEFYIDYIQLMSSDDPRHSDFERVTKVSRNIKMIALDLDLPIIALAQVSRDIERRPLLQQTPKLSDLKDSGSLEQDANVVVFWTNFDILGIDDFMGKRVENMGLFDIAKARSGGDKPIYLRVSNSKMRYFDDELTPEDFEKNTEIDDLPF